MASFSYASSPVVVTDEIVDSHETAWRMLASPGTWWTSAERLTIGARARTAFAQRHQPPWLRDLGPTDLDATLVDLDATLVDLVDVVAVDAHTITREWAAAAVEAIGDGPYVEMVAVVATVVMVDMFSEAAGIERPPLPAPRPGEPSRERPDGLGDIGAYVAVLEPFPHANVARALSLVPEANRLFRTVSVPSYSAPGFSDLVWNTPLTRPQVELVASRVAAMNECFY